MFRIGEFLRGKTGSIPVVMPAIRMAGLFALAVAVSALPQINSLIAAAVSAKEVSFMMKDVLDCLFVPVTQGLSAVWYSCVAAGALPLSIRV